MRTRLSKKTLTALRKAGNAYGLSHSTIVGKALRKYRRIRPDVSGVDVGSTTGGEAIRLNVPANLADGLSQGEIRQALQWYLDLHDLKPADKFAPDLIEGRDYVVR